MRRFASLAAPLSAALLATGCLGNTYTVRSAELRRIAQLAPEQHGFQVRATQRFVTSGRPPEGAPQVIIVGATPLPAPLSPMGPVRGPGGGARGGGGHQVSSASMDADDAAVVVVLAVLASVGLAVSEGARYDGWLATSPNTPLYLRMPEGWRQLPLAYLDPDTASRARYGVLVDQGRFSRLGRAPLDRIGMTYAVDLGAGNLDGQGFGDAWGFSSRISFGGFFLPWLGILGTVGLAWAGDGLDTIFVGRYGGELQAYPLGIGHFHFGGYAGAGYQRAKRDIDLDRTYTRSTPYYSFGGVLQIELTTRLALTLRGGESVTSSPTGSGTKMSPELSIGLAIY